jgi:hypothetical protein
MVVSPSEGGDGGAPEEEAVTSASCRAAATVSASRTAAEACSSLRRRGDGADAGLSLGGLKGGHLVSDALL